VNTDGHGPAPTERRSDGIGPTILIGLALAGYLAIVDTAAGVAVGLVPAGLRWRAIEAAALAAGAFAALYAGLLALIGWLGRRRWGLERGPLAAGLAGFLYPLMVLQAPIWLPEASPLARWAAVTIGGLILATIGGWAFYRTAKRFAGRRPSTASLLLTSLFVAGPGPWLLLDSLREDFGQTGQVRAFVKLVAFSWVLVALAAIPPRRPFRTDAVSAGTSGLLGLLLGYAMFRLLTLSWPEPGRAPAGRPPTATRVLLITIDTLRADALGSYGNPRIETPALDGLAGRSIQFMNAQAPSSWTLPSVATILTGLAPDVHGAVRVNTALPETVRTLAERLSGSEIQTAAFVNNPYLEPPYRLDQGFRTYQAYPRELPGLTVGAALQHGLLGRPVRIDGSPASLTDRAIDWLGTEAWGPFFLWVHYFDPHIPYAPGRRWRPEAPPPAGRTVAFHKTDPQPEDEAGRQWVRTLYEAEVRGVDAEIGRLLAAFRRLGLEEQTLIVVTSDHGEEFWEHDGFEHGHTLYRELLHVPLLIRPPGLAAARRIEAPVGLDRLAPTILELCGIQADPDHFSGRSLVPHWSEAEAPHTQSIFGSTALFERELRSVRSGAFKLIEEVDGGSAELYNVLDDPGETQPMAGEPERMADLRRQLQEGQAAAERLREQLNLGPPLLIEVDPEAMARLRALGYLK